MKLYHEKKSVYAYTTTSKQEKVQSICIEMINLDNDPQHFWFSFTNALSLGKVWFSQLESQKEFPFTAKEQSLFIAGFIRQLQSAPLVIIFNNFQLITNGLIRAFIKGLLEIPHQYLFLLILNYQSNILHDKKDSFSNSYYYLTKQEEWDFYKQYQIDINEDELNLIRSYSNGWLAAVNSFSTHLTANRKPLLDKLEDYILTFSEVYFFNKCSKLKQDTVVLFSLLESFPLEFVEYLAKEHQQDYPVNWFNSPFVRYDSETKHFSFAGFIQSQLQRRQVLLSNRQKERFYLKAGSWYQSCGDIISAINIYRKAHAYRKIIQVIQQWKFPSSANLANCYIQAINELPATLLDRHPNVQIIQCYMLNTLYRYKDSYQLLTKFISHYHQGNEIPAKTASLLSEAYFLLAWCNNAMCLDISDTFSYYKQSAEFFQNENTMIPHILNLFSDIPAICLYSPAAGSLEKYAEYMLNWEPFLSQVTRQSWSGCRNLAIAEMNFYTRNFREAESYSQKSINAAIKHNQIDVLCSSYYLLMRLNMAKGNYKRLMENFELLNKYAKWADYETFFSMPDLAKSWLMLALGKKEEIAPWLRHESQYQAKVLPANYGRDRIIQCYYLLLSQQYEEALAYAEVNNQLMADSGLHLLRIQLLMIKAVAYHKLKEPLLSVKMFEEVYQWTYQNHIIMPIIEYGKLVRPLIENCKKVTDCLIPENWLKEIAKKSDSYYTYQNNIRKKFNLDHLEKGNSRPLSPTEQELIILISQGLTLKTIAEMKGKSISSVKGICRQVYLKLNVSNRIDAVRAATILGLLDEQKNA